MTDALGLAEKVNKFNQQAMKHMESQSLNPFSGRFSRSPSPRPKFSKEEYGKPVAGSKTEMRGRKAHSHINREVLELCECIHDVGSHRRDSDGTEQVIVSFGVLFGIYSKISDKVVGLLIAAKKRGYVYFEPEILFQRRDDDVLIALMKPINEIRDMVKEQLAPSPAPPANVSTPPIDKTEVVSTPVPCDNAPASSSDHVELTAVSALPTIDLESSSDKGELEVDPTSTDGPPSVDVPAPSSENGVLTPPPVPPANPSTPSSDNCEPTGGLLPILPADSPLTDATSLSNIMVELTPSLASDPNATPCDMHELVPSSTPSANVTAPSSDQDELTPVPATPNDAPPCSSDKDDLPLPSNPLLDPTASPDSVTVSSSEKDDLTQTPAPPTNVTPPSSGECVLTPSPELTVDAPVPSDVMADLTPSSTNLPDVLPISDVNDVPSTDTPMISSGTAETLASSPASVDEPVVPSVQSQQAAL